MKAPMKKIFSFVILTALALAWPCLIYGQASTCLNCVGRRCQTGSVGGCACIITYNGGCATCGICIYNSCIQDCLTPSSSASADQGTSSIITNQVRATPEQLAAHAWLNDRVLVGDLTKYSPGMAQLIESEQVMLKSAFCPGFRRGTGQVKPDDDTTGYKWELIVRPDADEYRLKRKADGVEVRLLLVGQRWLLFSGDDYSNLLGKGDIAAK